MGPRSGRGQYLGAEGQQPGVVRFIGVDGYRWMIRCVVNGLPERADALAAEAREALADTVVRRGDTPLPVRTPLPCSCPSRWPPSCAPPPNRPRQQAQARAQAQEQVPPEPAARRSAEGSAMQQLRTHHRRLDLQQGGHARSPQRDGSAPISSSVTVCSDARGPRPTPIRRRPPPGAPGRRWPRPRPSAPSVASSSLGWSARCSRPPRPSHRVATATAPTHDRVSSSASHGGSTPASAAWRRHQAVAAQQLRGMAGGQRSGRRVGLAGPRRQCGQHRHHPAGMLTAPTLLRPQRRSTLRPTAIG